MPDRLGSDQTQGVTRSDIVDRLIGLRRIIILDVAGPLIAYSLLRDHGSSKVLALILSGILPAVGVLIDFARQRRLDVVGAVVLGGIVCGVILGLITHSSRALLLEGSVVTAAFAITALASLRTLRPLMYHFALASMGGPHTDAGQEFENRYTTQPGVSRYFRIVTLVWGIAFLVEAALKVLVIQASSTGFALAFTRIVPYPLAGILVFWMITWGRILRRRAQQQSRTS